MSTVCARACLPALRVLALPVRELVPGVAEKPSLHYPLAKVWRGCKFKWRSTSFKIRLVHCLGGSWDNLG